MGPLKQVAGVCAGVLLVGVVQAGPALADSGNSRAPVPDDRAYLTTGEAARILGVSPKTVSRWAAAGRIPHVVTPGGHRRFSPEAIRGVAPSMEMGPTEEDEDDSSA